MSDHEADATGQDAESHTNDSYSSNGHEPGGQAVATEEHGGASPDDGSSFLADLARAMQTTAAAEQARNAEGTEQRRQTHVDAIREREALEAEELRELAKEDVSGIDAWSDGEIKRIKLERERRIAARREQLQVRLEEHRTVVGREVEAVEAAVAAYKTEIEHYFRRLDAETDPVAIAKQAGTRPLFPVLELIGPDDAPATSEFKHVLSDAPLAAQAAPVASTVEVTSQTGDSAGGAIAANGLIGVMDPEANAGSTEAPWEPGSDAVAAEATDDVAPVNDGPEAPAGSDGSKEPVAAVAEAKVVMPRSTGAGSWLRWPNSSADHSDGGH